MSESLAFPRNRPREHLQSVCHIRFRRDQVGALGMSPRRGRCRRMLLRAGSKVDRMFPPRSGVRRLLRGGGEAIVTTSALRGMEVHGMGGGAGRIRIGAIMAGGTGERFWPVSRPDRPKQLLPLGPSNRTLLEDTVSRFNGVVPSERLLIVTSKGLRAPIVAAELPLPDDHVIAEPSKRNTLGAVAWLTAHVTGRLGAHPDETTLAIVSADQYVGNVETLRSNLTLAMTAAERLDSLVIVGVQPTRPETGYGYIEMGKSAEPLMPDVEGADRVHQVAAFREKPDAVTAEEYFRSGGFLWNAGMFFWGVSTFMRELEAAQPEVAGLVRDMTRALAEGEEAEAERLFAELPATSIDYALMEHAEDVLVVRAGFAWDDIGAWDAWRRMAECDERGNAIVGDPLLIDCHDCAVYDELGDAGISVAVIGMDEVVVAATSDGVLVAPLERAQEVRDVARRIHQTRRDTRGSE